LKRRKKKLEKTRNRRVTSQKEMKELNGRSSFLIRKIIPSLKGS